MRESPQYSRGRPHITRGQGAQQLGESPPFEETNDKWRKFPTERKPLRWESTQLLSESGQKAVTNLEENLFSWNGF